MFLGHSRMIWESLKLLEALKVIGLTLKNISCFDCQMAIWKVSLDSKV